MISLITLDRVNDSENGLALDVFLMQNQYFIIPPCREDRQGVQSDGIQSVHQNTFNPLSYVDSNIMFAVLTSIDRLRNYYKHLRTRR